MVVRRLALLLALSNTHLAGCDWGLGSEPMLPPCAAGHVRAPDGAATTDGCQVATATIAIDGQTADWDAVDTITLTPVTPACTLPPCEGLLAGTLQVALEPCFSEACVPRVYFRVRLANGAAPRLDDPALRFALQLAPTAQRPAAETDVLLAGAFGVSFEKNGHDVDPPVGAPAYEFAWTADGYEAAIPSDYLPLRGAALVSPFAARQVDTSFTSVSAPLPVAVVCWEPRPDLRDPCDALAAAEVAR